jgi:hypothetical protein
VRAIYLINNLLDNRSELIIRLSLRTRPFSSLPFAQITQQTTSFYTVLKVLLTKLLIP